MEIGDTSQFFNRLWRIYIGKCPHFPNYTDEHGNKPFREWLQALRDQIAAVRIHARLTRVRAGNFGAVRNVGEGVVELKIDHGPGYRVYYAIDAGTIVLLLCGGDKRTQQRDIENAQRFWKNHQEQRK